MRPVKDKLTVKETFSKIFLFMYLWLGVSGPDPRFLIEFDFSQGLDPILDHLDKKIQARIKKKVRISQIFISSNIYGKYCKFNMSDPRLF